jgi:hypothetical protein
MEMGPIASALRADLDRCLQAVEAGRDVSRVFLDLCGYITHAFDELERQINGRGSSVQQIGDLVEDINIPIQVSRTSPDTVLALTPHLDENWDKYRIPMDWGHVLRREIPTHVGSEPHWVKDTDFVRHFAASFNLPMPDQIGHLNGHPSQLQIARKIDAATLTYYATMHGYVLGAIHPSQNAAIKELMTQYNTHALRVAASIFHGQGDIWRIVYYL